MKTSLMIIFGGSSNEHEVSLRSAAAVIENTDKAKYDLICMGITKSGEWYIYNGPVSKIQNGEWERDLKNLTHVAVVPNGERSTFLCLSGSMKQIRPDVIFPVVHGQNCEDGRLQGLLDLLQIPYVGCGCFSSALCMDKAATKSLLENLSIPMAKWELVKKDEINPSLLKRLEKSIGYPMFVKPSNSGSSVGAAKAQNEKELFDALTLAAEVDEKILVEEYVDGREVELAVLDATKTVVSPSGEIESGAVFYDYDTKYKNNTAKYFIPARIKPETENRIRELALKIFRALDCRDFSRVDFFVTRDEKIIFNEINTLPGFTSISMYPKLMDRAGVQFALLIDELVTEALRHK